MPIYAGLEGYEPHCIDT